MGYDSDLMQEMTGRHNKTCQVNLTYSLKYYILIVRLTLHSERGIMKNRIKELREKLGITQEQLGQLVGTSRQALNALETEKNEPSIWLAYDIAQVFHEPIERVFLFEESERKSRADLSRGIKNGVERDQNL